MIEVTELTKRFGKTLAVDGLTFTVQPGRVTGFLGPNGAGKSTTMRMIIGLDHPDGRHRPGQRHGRFAEHQAPLREVGALLEASSVHQRPQRAAPTCCRWPRTQRHPGPAGRRGPRARRAWSRSRHRRAGSFSLGMSQRLGIAAALLGDPADPDLRRAGQRAGPGRRCCGYGTCCKELAAEGRTVLVSSHLMSEMAVTADHLVIIGRGRLLADTRVDELIARVVVDRVVVRTPQATELR